MSKVSKVELSIQTGHAFIYLDNGKTHVLQVSEAAGAGGAQIVTDSGNGEIADYLDGVDTRMELIALITGDDLTEIEAKIEEANTEVRAKATDWKVVYTGAKA